MDDKQENKGLRAYINHIRFRERREGWPPIDDEVLRKHYTKLCARTAAREQEIRKRLRILLAQEAMELTQKDIPKGLRGSRPVTVNIYPVISPPSPPGPAALPQPPPAPTSKRKTRGVPL